jgi:D-alanine-D-alanine ligase
MGGRSAEREVSLKSGEAVYTALIKKGYHAVRIDAVENAAEEIRKEKIDIAFIALHGSYGEDGSVQGLLEMMGVPYTGSGIKASAICIDKITTKKLIGVEALPTPRYTVASRKNYLDNRTASITKVLREFSPPLIVKPPTQGSTIGTSFVLKEEDLGPALSESFKYGSQALIEEFIPGIEITSSILGNDEPVALPLIEIVSKTGVYDYEAKYTAGMSDHIIPPRISLEMQEKIKDLALKVYKTLDCRGFARVDFMMGQKNDVYVLEVNTIPGMTEVSLYPDAARAAGIEFPDLVERLVKLGLEGTRQEK